MQADFANEYLGGGAAEFGNVQEEILFLTHPELFAAQLICEVMDPCEAITMQSMRRYSLHSGYGDSLAFAGRCIDSVEERSVVAFDAVVSVIGLKNQLHEELVMRDLTKALGAFTPTIEGDKRTLVTGKWGCGVFNGNPELKFLI